MKRRSCGDKRAVDWTVDIFLEWLKLFLTSGLVISILSSAGFKKIKLESGRMITWKSQLRNKLLRARIAKQKPENAFSSFILNILRTDRSDRSDYVRIISFMIVYSDLLLFRTGKHKIIANISPIHLIIFPHDIKNESFYTSISLNFTF